MERIVDQIPKVEQFVILGAKGCVEEPTQLGDVLYYDDLIAAESPAIDWPEFDEKLAAAKTIELVIQINGKVRAKLEADADISEKEAIKLVKDHPNIKFHVEGKTVVKEIFVPGKLINLVVK